MQSKILGSACLSRAVRRCRFVAPIMNRNAVLFHLREANEELDRTIDEVFATPDYGQGEFVVAMSHLYGHLNTAWNGRDASEERHRECSQADFDTWRKFPPDEELWLV